jgi:uncharacterized protein YndB with AHSA1/START domain
MRFSNTVEIRRSPAEVFSFLATPENIPTWNHAIVESRAEPRGPMRVGTLIEQRRTQPRPAREQLEVVELTDERLLVLEGDLGPLHGTISYRLEPIDIGTRLTNDADLAASGPLRLVAPLAEGRVRDSVAANLQALRRTLERG